MVGFRWFALTQAQQWHITGRVKNLSDGKVDILASGEEDNLNIFIEYLQRGPGRGRVDNLTREDMSNVQNFPDFQISG